MATKIKVEPVLVRAQHSTRKDRKGAPIIKTFTLDAWSSLHGTEWVEIDSKGTAAPAPLKAKAVTAKKLLAKKSTAKPKALKAKKK